LKERLQKILARAGFGSRRACEAIIASGRVRVNGAVVRELGTRADLESDRIHVDGEPLATAAVDVVVLIMNKPAGYTTTTSDPHAERTVMQLLPQGLPPGVLPVGRLDRETSGLLVFTNDGELAHRLAHPSFETTKEYFALVRGIPDARALRHLRRGVEIDGRRTAPAAVEIAAPPPGHGTRDGSTWLRLEIHEGRKRQVRLMCAAVGHSVRDLVRTRVGPLGLGRLQPGRTRRLNAKEVAAIRRAVAL
jgi:pseudouridine synthase